MITMEFGDPYLAVREPVTPSESASDKVRRNLSRRRISVLGQWHFWIEHAHWTLRTKDKTAGSQTSMQSEMRDILSDLDGQKLLAVEPISAVGRFRLAFDLDAILEIWPATDIDADQWSLREKGGPFLIAAMDGSLSYIEAR
ncbi:hypothetical protein [Acidisoma silvae]|uniref:Uncharacterized protein n=1 Tax=Acidisoma silvae TaxID=2802396 RepID=A0A964DXP3_9PROT|nr:hypothetical protein [Acidisoma silvae]MCB8874426.1 hypothetical protein [Acidisoma silvae]